MQVAFPEADSTLGYRSVLTLAGPRQDIPRLVEQQIYLWLRTKGWDPDVLRPGIVGQWSNGASGQFDRLEREDGSTTIRLSTAEVSGWRTRLTVDVPSSPARSPWLWMDVYRPAGQSFAGTPKIVSNLLEVLDARDGAHRLPPEVVTVRPDGVVELIDRLIDPGRRTLTFVAGSSGGVPFDGWVEHVEKLTRRNSGLASTHVLTPDATVEFQRRVGSAYAVAPFTVRTFLPSVDFDDPDHAIRHRYLTMQRITADKPGVLAQVLNGRAIAHSLALPLPKETIRVDRMLQGSATAALLDALTALPVRGKPPARPTTDPLSAATAPLPVEPSATVATTDPADDAKVRSPADYVVTAPEVVEIPTQSNSQPPTVGSKTAEVSQTPARVWELLAESVAELGGESLQDEDAVRRLVEFARLGQQAAQSKEIRDQQLADLQDQVVNAELTVLDRDQLIQDTITNQSIAELNLLRSEDLVRRLRLRLRTSDRAAEAWLDQPLTDDELVPLDFTELLERLGQMNRVRFTGDPDVARSLDAHGIFSWSALTWTAMGALQDYAECRLGGQWTGDLEAFLKATPPGMRGFPPGKFARDETQTLRENSKYAKPRTLPVPVTVSATGELFMGAHFKIANWQRVSPRMHVFDDVTRTGVVYIGYIGPHLPSSQTN